MSVKSYGAGNCFVNGKNPWTEHTASTFFYVHLELLINKTEIQQCPSILMNQLNNFNLLNLFCDLAAPSVQVRNGRAIPPLPICTYGVAVNWDRGSYLYLTLFSDILSTPKAMKCQVRYGKEIQDYSLNDYTGRDHGQF